MSTRPQIVVVGGGIAGLMGAIIAAESGADVTLLESEPTVGGLLRSRTLPGGDIVDYGTHIPTSTGSTELDAKWLNLFEPEEVIELPGLIPGVFAHGQLRPRTMWLPLDSSTTDSGDEAPLHRALREHAAAMDAAPPAWLSAPSAAAGLRSLYGETVAESAFEPVVRKLQGCSSAELHPEVLRLFGLQRVVAFSEEDTRQLKTDPRFDAFLAYHDCLEGGRARRVFYPRNGIGAWIDRLLAMAEQAGVRVRTAERLTEVAHADGRVTAVSLASGETLLVDGLVWSIPAAMLLRSARLPTSGGPPKMLTTVLVDLVYDRPLQAESQYISCFDPTVAAFRLTLYQNLRPVENGRYAITLEYLCDAAEETGVTEELAHDELVRMDLVAPDARRLASHRLVHRGGFPVLTHAFFEAMRSSAAQVSDALSNVVLVGKAGGKDFFMIDVMRDISERIPAWAGDIVNEASV